MNDDCTLCGQAHFAAQSSSWISAVAQYSTISEYHGTHLLSLLFLNFPLAHRGIFETDSGVFKSSLELCIEDSGFHAGSAVLRVYVEN